MSNVLITGAAGFLGCYISERCLADGHVVWGIDDFCTSLGKSAPHIAKISDDVNFHMIEADVCDKVVFDDLVSNIKHFDVVYNFACPASPPRYQSMPIKTMMTCVVGTKNVLSFAKATDARVVHASTSEIYGDPLVSPQRESYKGNVNSYGPRACYDEGKRAAEALCYDYVNTYNLDVRIARIFNTYGARMDTADGRVVSNFMCQALRNEPITVYGFGTQTRSFCYVDDLINGIMLMGNAHELQHEPINLGNDNEMTVEELALKITKLTASTSKIVYKPFVQDDPTQRRPDTTLAKELLNWEPVVSLDDGLERTAEWFISQM